MFKLENADRQILSQIAHHELFDFYRIVDVDTYSVYDWHNGAAISTNERCYEIWKRGDACKNCISRTSTLEKKRIIKLEYFEGQIFLIMAVPITLNNTLYSLELISNVTNSLVINDDFHAQNISAQGIINQMNDVAVRDSYTGLYNKRYAEQELCKAVLEWKSGDRLSIGMLDIDHFKQINDTYGHVEGDNVLTVLSKILDENAVKSNGWVSRIGGDEFMLFWKDIQPQAVREVAQKIQKEIGEYGFCKNDIDFTVSVSIGIAQYHPELTDWKAFLDEADSEMYRHKREKYKNLDAR